MLVIKALMFDGNKLYSSPPSAANLTRHVTRKSADGGENCRPSFPLNSQGLCGQGFPYSGDEVCAILNCLDQGFEPALFIVQKHIISKQVSLRAVLPCACFLK